MEPPVSPHPEQHPEQEPEDLEPCHGGRRWIGTGHKDTQQGGSTFRLVTYNLLAQALVKRDLYPHCSKLALKLKSRVPLLVQELLALQADVLCCQELDFLGNLLEREPFVSRYPGHRYLPKPGGKHGLAVFWDVEVFELLEYQTLVYAAAEGPEEGEGDVPVGQPDRRNVAQLLALRHAPSQAILLLTNTHLHWRPEALDIKEAQVRELLQAARAFRDQVEGRYGEGGCLCLCGDWNITPATHVYAGLVAEGEDALPRAAGLGRLQSAYATYQDLVPPPPRRHAPGEAAEAEAEDQVIPWRGEPPFTTLTPSWHGTLDYIFVEADAPTPRARARVLRLLDLPSRASLLPGLPNAVAFASDHLALAADLCLG
jgi:mRNA deadenylase 3'-5' endonuclease subunit Ccr4